MVRKAILYLFMTSIVSVITLPLVDGSQDQIQCYEGPHVVISSGSAKGTCHSCKDYACPDGYGLTVECSGQNVSGDVIIHCVPCVAGINFSTTHDYHQCQPCPQCKGVYLGGKCEQDGDHRKCATCSKGWYFNETDKICSPCPCQHISEVVKEKCLKNGFDFELNCSKPVATSPSLITTGGSEKHWSITKTVGVSMALLLAFVVCYCCLVVKNLKNFARQRSHYPHGLKEYLKVFCLCSFTHRTPAHDNSGEPGESGILDSDCRKEKFAVSKLNSKTFKKLCQGFSVSGALNNNFECLAGRLGYNVEEASEFEQHKYPVKTMVLNWGQKNGNNILKLKQLLQDMGRDDLVELLEKELSNVSCQCTKCQICMV